MYNVVMLWCPVSLTVGSVVVTSRCQRDVVKPERQDSGGRGSYGRHLTATAWWRPRRTEEPDSCRLEWRQQHVWKPRHGCLDVT